MSTRLMIMVIQNLLLVSIVRLCQVSNVFQRVPGLADAGTDSPLQGRRRSRVCVVSEEWRA